jgi:hypothetical protein
MGFAYQLFFSHLKLLIAKRCKQPYRSHSKRVRRQMQRAQTKSKDIYF